MSRASLDCSFLVLSLSCTLQTAVYISSVSLYTDAACERPNGLLLLDDNLTSYTED